MRFLLLNQNFYPDVVATGQYLAELGVAMAERGHQVTVIASRRGYDHPERLFPAKEMWKGIRILRVGSTGFGKRAKWRRAADFASFLISCVFRLLFLPRQDVTVALTSPPLISFLGALFAKLRGGRFVYWVMDLNPDEAIAAGWLRPNSIGARLLESMSRFSFRQADAVIALDCFMRDRIVAKGIPAAKVYVLPPWSHDGEVRFDPVGREAFRKTHGLEGKFVVMYSGNHSPCHPLDTLLAASERLRSDGEIVFCFVGGGSEWRKIKDAAKINVLCLPYQPLNALSASLSAGDLHVVVMGDPFVGIVHPCKIYNVLGVAAPVLCIGPVQSHLVDLAQGLNPTYPWAHVRHGEVDEVVRRIKEFKSRTALRKREVPANVCAEFEQQAILPQLIAVLENDLRHTSTTSLVHRSWQSKKENESQES